MPDTVARLRAFNRRWTEVLGLLERHLLGTPYSLAESRVLFELAGQDCWERLDLRQRLGTDATSSPECSPNSNVSGSSSRRGRRATAVGGRCA